MLDKRMVACCMPWRWKSSGTRGAINGVEELSKDYGGVEAREEGLG